MQFCKLRPRGIALLEMAMVLPLLLLVVFGILSFGIALYDQSVITNASREGARRGIVSAVSKTGVAGATCATQTVVATAASAQAVAVCAAKRVLTESLITFGIGTAPTVTASSTAATGGACTDPPGPKCIIKVTVSYPFAGVYVIDALMLSASTSMFYE